MGKAVSKTFNEQAAFLVENCLDLIKQVLVKHETAVMAEFRTIIEAKNHELSLIYAQRDALQVENEALRQNLPHPSCFL